MQVVFFYLRQARQLFIDFNINFYARIQFYILLHRAHKVVPNAFFL